MKWELFSCPLSIYLDWVVNNKKTACMPFVRPSSFSLFLSLSPLLYPFSMCFPRQCRKARESHSQFIYTVRTIRPSHRPTTPFGQPTNPFPFYSRSCVTIRIFIFTVCSLIIYIYICSMPAHCSRRLPRRHRRKGQGSGVTLSLSLSLCLSPPGPLSCPVCVRCQND